MKFFCASIVGLLLGATIFSFPKAVAAECEDVPLVESPFETSPPPSKCVPKKKELQKSGKDDEKSVLFSPKRSSGLLIGFSNRGVLAESGSFFERITFEGGLWSTQPFAFDIAVGVGRLFEKNAQAALDAHARIWPLTFFRDEDDWHTLGAYVGGGYLFSGKRKLGYGVLGMGRALFIEANIRESDERPLAAILAFGIRIRY